MQDQPNNVSEMREKLQNDIVNIITRKLESGEMNEERAKAIAKMALEKLPEDISYERLMEIAPTLDDEFEELRTAVLPIIIEYQEKVAEQVKVKISDLMQQKNYEESLKLAQQQLEFERNLV